MFDCLINYWKNIDLKGNHLIHESDKDLEEKSNQISEECKLHFELFPEPFNGSLRSPKIVFLYLNPGFNEADNEVKPLIRKDVITTFSQKYLVDDEYPFFWLNPDYDERNKKCTNRADIKIQGNPGAYYWNKLFDQKTKTSFLEKLAEEHFNKDKGEARKWIANNVCDIELFPYHSEKFHYSFAKCKSADVARCNVFEEIKRHDDVLFVLMRSRKLWTCELEEREELLDKRDFKIDKKGNVIINPCPRNPSLNPEKNLGGAIYEWLKDRL